MDDLRAPAPPPLEYGISPPRTRRRVVRVLVVLIAVAACYFAWEWGSDALNHANILRRQRECLTYTARRDRVIYEEDPAQVPGLLNNGQGYVRYPLQRAHGVDATLTKSFAAVAPIPDCWTRFRALVPSRNLRGVGQPGGAVLFLHERISPEGNRRLVCVRYYPETHSFTPQFLDAYNCEQTVITPATWTTPASESRKQSSIDVLSGFPMQPPHVRVFAGQADPHDDAHFTIRYQMWGKEDVLDGRLADDDQITLTPRMPPME